MSRYARVRRGFTLIEMLSVVVISGILMAIGVDRMTDALDGAREVQAIADLKAMVAAIEARDDLPQSLAEIGFAGRVDPWGQPYVYYPFPDSKGKGPPQGARKDRFLVPINSRYDLYSVGKDGGTVAALTAKASHDDIIVANDGGFVGKAIKY